MTFLIGLITGIVLGEIADLLIVAYAKKHPSLRNKLALRLNYVLGTKPTQINDDNNCPFCE